MSFCTRIITFVVLLSLVTYAAEECDPRFTDTVNLRVFNADYTPIEGATVNIQYQLDQTTAKGYFTITKTTNAQGEVGVTVHNLEPDPEKVDCNIEINVTFDAQETTQIVKAQAHPNPVDIFLEAHILTIRVVDQENRALEGAEIFIENRNATTDATGRAAFLVGAGDVSIVAKYDVGKVEETIEVTEAGTHTIGFAFYPLTLRVLDDVGNPLPARADVENETYNFDGELTLPKLVKPRPAIKVYYENLEKAVDVDLSQQNEYAVVFDFHPPAIVSAQPKRSGDRMRLELGITDEGPQASGVGAEAIRVDYRFDSNDWRTARVYSVAHNLYGADFGIPDDSAMLFFTVEANDREGNRARLEGQLALEAPVTPANTTNATEVPAPETPPAAEIPWVAVGGLVVVAVGIYIVYRFKLSQGGGG